MIIKKKKNNKNNNKKIYLGIQLLRMILSFLIVIIHCFRISNKKSYLIILPFRLLCFYVPTFFILSFYFSYNSIFLRHINRIIERFKRILIPYIIWPIIILIKNILNYYYFHNNKAKLNIKMVKNLYYQLLIGCGIHGIFWFLFNLIFISLFIVIIIFMFKKNYIYILFLICLIVILNYFNYINLIFSKYNKIPVHHSIKPLSNTFIYATTGLYLASLDILNKFSVYRIKLLLFLFLLLLCIIKYYNLINIKFYFLNNILIDIVGIWLILFFSLLPFDKIENFFIKSLFIHITSFTGGIYYLHPEVKYIFKNVFNSIYNGTFKGSILIYIK